MPYATAYNPQSYGFAYGTLGHLGRHEPPAIAHPHVQMSGAGAIRLEGFAHQAAGSAVLRTLPLMVHQRTSLRAPQRSQTR